jgi:N-acetylmuramoyl-L-alanine amidase
MGFCLLALGASCDPAGGSGAAPSAPAAALTDPARAEVLLSPDAPLPSRAETVALADAVAVASAKAGATPEGAALALLAADLRARSWRVDRAAADAHEAQELYRAAAAAFGPTVEGCRASLRGALFAGELAQDAAATYRALYLTERV